MASIQCFPPISSPDARILILGSMPGEASLAAGEYYAHPRNAFWQLLGKILGFSPTAPYPMRRDALLTQEIAVWDVLGSCERVGSLDSSIHPASMVPNDFNRFVQDHPGLTHFFFNGGTAEVLFKRLVSRKKPAIFDGLLFTRLPSTSPAHASLSFERKLEIWKQHLGTVILRRPPEGLP